MSTGEHEPHVRRDRQYHFDRADQFPDSLSVDEASGEKDRGSWAASALRRPRISASSIPLPTIRIRSSTPGQ